MRSCSAFNDLGLDGMHCVFNINKTRKEESVFGLTRCRFVIKITDCYKKITGYEFLQIA